MKRIFFAAVSVIIYIMCMGFNAVAAELDFTCSVTPQGVIKVSGQANPGFVSVEIIRNYDENSIPGERDAVVIDAAATDENGKFSFEWSLPADEQSQYYMVVIGNTDSYKEESESSKIIYFATETDVNSVIELINNAESIDGLKEKVFDVKRNTDIIQISDSIVSDTYKNYENEILNNIISQRGEGYTSLEDFRIAFDKAVATSEFIRITENTFDSFVLKYADVMNFDTQEYNKSISARYIQE